MKLLWLSHLVPYPPAGGSLQRSFNLLREAGRRHDVHFVALDQPRIRGPGEDLETAREALSDFTSQVEIFPIPAERSRYRWWWTVVSSFFSRRPYDVNWLWSDPFRAHLTEVRASTTVYDLVHVDTLGLAPHARLVGDVPVVLNHHNVESQMTRQRAETQTGLLKRLYLRREARKLAHFERRFCSEAAMNTVVSDLDGERLREVAGEVSVTVVENGVDVDYFRPETPPGHGDGGLVFAGGMGWYPNRDAMLFFVREIWPLLAEEDPDREVTVIGEAPPRELQELAGDSDRVSAPGFVDDVRPYLDRASIYVCPIRRGGGTRLKILDALAMAKPLVATRFAVQGLDLVEERHFLPADSPEEYLSQIRRLEQDARLRTRLAREGRTLVENQYSWAVVGEHLERAYRRAGSSDPN